MKNEQVLELMNAIPPDLIEEADLRPAAKRRLPRLARTGLIAACLCLALIGTAASARFLSVGIVEGDNGYTYLQGGIIYHPYDSLSDEIKELADQPSVIKPFGSWQEAEDFIGVDLMNNPVLDMSPARTYSIRIDNGETTVNGRFLVVTTPGMYFVRTHGCYEMDEVTVNVESAYYTDHDISRDGGWDERFYGFHPLEGAELNRETYTAPSGLAAQLMAIDRPDGHRDTYLAAFSLNGVPFIVRTHSYNSLDEARAALLQVLDGFILSE